MNDCNHDSVCIEKACCNSNDCDCQGLDTICCTDCDYVFEGDEGYDKYMMNWSLPRMNINVIDLSEPLTAETGYALNQNNGKVIAWADFSYGDSAYSSCCGAKIDDFGFCQDCLDMP